MAAQGQPHLADPSHTTEPRTGDGTPGARTIVRGACYVLFAYDIGFGVDMEHAARLVSEPRQPAPVRRRRRAPAWFEYEPTPLAVVHDAEPAEVAGLTTDRAVECTVFDFGAVSVRYRIPIVGPVDRLPELTAALYDNDTLLADARARIEAILAVIEPAVTKPGISDLVEDYVVLAFDDWGGAAAGAFIEEHHEVLARVLQAERGSLSEDLSRETLSSRLSFSPGDITVVDWNAALLLDEDPGDVLTLLEHANIELVEMRFLDGKLDRLLERAHELLLRQSDRSIWPGAPGTRQLRDLAEAQMDASLLFEGVNNAIKLLGDQYLARLYRMVSEKLHIPDWESSVQRKLEVTENIYSKIGEFQTTRRLEILEIIIILLIALSIILVFIPGVY